MNTRLRLIRDTLITLLEHHPKRITAALATLLLGGAGGAYAVASLGPDASQLPVREILQAVQTLPLATQAEALDSHSINLYRNDVSRSTDSAESLLQRLGVADPAAASFLRRDPLVYKSLLGRGGRVVSVTVNDRHELQSLTARWITSDSATEFQRLVVKRDGEKFNAELQTAPLVASTRLAGGVIQSSLFGATDDAGIPDAIATQMAEIFSGNIDFHRALRKGDRFSVVYETLEADGEPLRAGRVLSSEFVNAGKAFQAMWFQEDGHKGGYYTLDGDSLRRAYLASPMAFSRVTSGFKMRFHPILQTWRAHLGVDYGAPTGTPVRTIGDGVVDFAGVQNGFGNVVMIKHNAKDMTVYAHLSRINVRKGQSVGQGDTIGAVGSTGWATGPHLHFEFRVNGQHQDPMIMARASESVPISAAAKAAFSKAAEATRTSLAAAHTVAETSAQ